MRRLPIDRCPSCGIRAVANTYCVRCEVDMVDANGHARLEPTVIERSASFTRAGYARIAFFAFVVLVCLAVFVRVEMHGPAFVLAKLVVVGTVQAIGFFVAIELSRTGATIHERVALAAAAASAPEKAVGRVVTLRPAVGSNDRATAARIVRSDRTETLRPLRWHLVAAPFDDMKTLIERTRTDASVSGRFAVLGPAGTAIVDDDAFVVVDGRPSPASVLDTLRDGDEVEVFGPARLGVAPDAAHLTKDGNGAALVFDGTPKNKVWVVVRRATRVEASDAARAAVPLAA